MLEEARHKEMLRSKETSLSKTGTVGLAGTSKRKKGVTAKPIAAKQIGIKGNLDKVGGKDGEKKVYYAGLTANQTKNIQLKGKDEIVTKAGEVSKGVILPSNGLESHRELEAAKVKAKEPKAEDEEGREAEVKVKKISRAQKILQANFLKAAQMDDPIKREWAMSRLQIL